MLEVFIASVLLVILRCLPLYFWDRDPTDAWAHIYSAKKIFENHGKIPDRLHQVLPSAENGYPPGVAVIINRYRNVDPFYVGIGLNFILFFVESIAIGFAAFLLGANDVMRVFFYTVIVQMCKPALMTPWAGFYGINGRIAGCVSTGLFVALIIINSQAFSLPVMFFLVILQLFMVYFSKFAIQALVLIFPFLIWIGDPVVVITYYAISFLLPLLLSPHEVFRIYKGSVGHSLFYAKFLQFRHASLTTRYVTLWRLVENLINMRFRPVQLIYCPLTRLLINNPMAIGVCYIYLQTESDQDIIGFAFYSVIFSVLLAILVDIKGLRFLGESDRYIMFITSTLVPIALVISSTSNDSVLTLVAFYSFFLQILYIYGQSRVSKSHDTREAEDAVSVLGCDGNVICFPTNTMQKMMMFSDCKFVGLYLNAPTFDRKNEDLLMKLYRKEYPYFDVDEDALKKIYNVKYIVVDKFHLTKFIEFYKYYMQFEKLNENNRYITYRLGSVG